MGTAAVPTTRTLPSTLKWAAWLAFTYAALVIANLIVVHGMNYWEDGLSMAAIFVAAGVGLLRRARWAWLLALAFCAFHLGADAIDLSVWLTYQTRWASYDSTMPQMTPRVAAVAASVLAALVVLLVHPRTRAAIRVAAV